MYAFTMILALLAQSPAEAGVDRVGLFTAERFRAHAAFLGSDSLNGRKAGSVGAAKAAEYIDDDASGVAAMLLIAEDLARNPGKRDDPRRRTVVFAAFGAEETGLLGAPHYAEHLPFPLEQTSVVLNFDIVGRLGRGRLFVTDAETSAGLGKSVRALAKSIRVPVETRVGGNYQGDQAMFLRRKIPSVQFFTGLHADYHEVTDLKNENKEDFGISPILTGGAETLGLRTSRIMTAWE